MRSLFLASYSLYDQFRLSRTLEKLVTIHRGIYGTMPLPIGDDRAMFLKCHHLND